MDNYARVTADQLRERLRRKEPALLLDLRDRAEFEREHIAGSMNLPIAELDVDVVLRERKGRQTIFLICSNGQRAYRAAGLFRDSAVADVIVLAGGILSWRVLGYPVVSSQH